MTYMFIKMHIHLSSNPQCCFSIKLADFFLECLWALFHSTHGALLWKTPWPLLFTPTKEYPQLLNEGVVLHLHTFLHYTRGLFSTTPNSLILCCTWRNISPTPHIIFFVLSLWTSTPWHPQNFHQLFHVPSFTTPSHLSLQQLAYLLFVVFVDPSPWLPMGFSSWNPYTTLFHDTRWFWT